MGEELKDRKVTAAISAAVLGYIREGRETAVEVARGGHPSSYWSLFGRHEQMNVRIMCQLRMIRN